ncbi:hypothetical protein Scep_028016 [Stephania cephalantha]|uniref:Uncharacterized protein n=1 Tax=Stephania cephalantha TaxID=152367 RepID=A0AAP0HJ41_9MAGN
MPRLLANYSILIHDLRFLAQNSTSLPRVSSLSTEPSIIASDFISTNLNR